MRFLDKSQPCSPPILKEENHEIVNLEYSLWVYQDQFILNVVVGYPSPTIISFITINKTSREAWTTLAMTCHQEEGSCKSKVNSSTSLKVLHSTLSHTMPPTISLQECLGPMKMNFT